MKEQKEDPSLRSGQDSEQASLGQTILQKLTTIEELLERKDDKPLTFKEACSYLGYAPSYLYKLTYKNIVPHYKPTGKIIFFSKNELDEWVFKSRSEKLEDSSENKTDNASATLSTKNPNQIEMDLTDNVSTGSAQEKEILIEFPLKSRRNK